MFENILNQVPNSQEPWLATRFDAWREELLEKARRRASATGERIATTGSNLLDTDEQRDARLLGEAQVAALEKGQQFNIDKMVSDANLEMEKNWSQAGTKGAEDLYKVAASKGAKDLRDDKKDMDLMEQAFLMTMMENMRGEDIGQAPAVVAGGGQRQWPSMMGQFAPWEQQKPYWWVA